VTPRDAAAGAPAGDPAGWTEVLDLLEREVEAAEQLLAAGAPADHHLDPGPWQAPPLAGPLPETLRTRASALARRQAAVQADLSRAALDVAAGLGRTRRPAFRGTSAAPVYVDVSA
jgi:hypothetical protein